MLMSLLNIPVQLQAALLSGIAWISGRFGSHAAHSWIAFAFAAPFQDSDQSPKFGEGSRRPVQGLG